MTDTPVAYVRDEHGSPKPVFVAPALILVDPQSKCLDIALLDDQDVLRAFSDIVATALSLDQWPDWRPVYLSVDCATWGILQRSFGQYKSTDKSLAEVVMLTNPWVKHIRVDSHLPPCTCEVSRSGESAVAA